MSSKMAIFHNDATQALVNKINETMLVRAVDNPCSIISHSAYDTAWVAMIGHPKHKYEKPMFGSCLEWILNNQNSEGFWGERDCNGNPTIDSLPATLACMVALKTWSLGHQHIDKGLTFIMANSTKFIERKGKLQKYPRWFVIVFAGMVELARRKGLRITFDDEIKETVSLVFRQQQEIFKT
ncbi:S-linalool synthase-like [Beta vulgaris subsp. vulgaris]|uniref:S-linalool synthase-like n=1 Tax=Beta vulgaris subsp. vulgaris TaxID=3555 RepID=UPI002548F360|nr:S-linalool synthase-like [Beta vulgaris subsp. vulgaris]